jgi:hypothetical protein
MGSSPSAWPLGGVSPSECIEQQTRRYTQGDLLNLKIFHDKVLAAPRFDLRQKNRTKVSYLIDLRDSSRT